MVSMPNWKMKPNMNHSRIPETNQFSIGTMERCSQYPVRRGALVAIPGPDSRLRGPVMQQLILFPSYINPGLCNESAHPL
jgi:hypothetical protein